MLVYEDRVHTVFAWNSVDVLVDGQLQHGEAMSVVDGGLIIDFRCAGQRAQFIPYGRIFDSRYLNAWPHRVQVLLRRSTDRAWVWYPGTAVDPNHRYSDRSTFVEVQLPYGTVRELLSDDQVRPVPSEKDLREWRLQEKHFVLRSCPLPATYWTDQSRVLKELFKCKLSRRCRVLCTSVLSQTLVYMQCQDATPLTAEQVEEVYAWAKQQEDDDFPSETAEYALCEMALRDASKKRKGAGHRRIRFPLPAELLVEVFQALGSIGGIRCRRVCQLWNTLLTTDANVYDPCVIGWCVDSADQPFGYDRYWMAVCLLKCLTRRTKTLIFAGMGLAEARHSSGLVRRLLNGHRLRTLVLYNCVLCNGEIQDCDVFKELTGLAGDCAVYKRMIWKRCRIVDESREAAVVQHTFTVQAGSKEMEKQMKDVCGKSRVKRKRHQLVNPYCVA